jgi:hypothetical protein
LQGKRELLLVKRSVLPSLGGNVVKGVGKTTDPNGRCYSLRVNFSLSHYISFYIQKS